MTIESNIAAREAADSATGDLETWAALAPEDSDLFWPRVLKNVLAAMPAELRPKPEVAPVRPMTPEQARDFEKCPMPFGQHEYKPIGEVPIDYLVWLDSQEDFRKLLSQYLLSEAGQARQEE